MKSALNTPRTKRNTSPDASPIAYIESADESEIAKESFMKATLTPVITKITYKDGINFDAFKTKAKPMVSYSSLKYLDEKGLFRV